MPTIKRSLQVKKVVPVEGERYPAIHPLDLHTSLRAAFAVAATVGARHHPAAGNIKPGATCVILEPTNKPGSSLLFHAYIYTAGRTPDQVVPDFAAAKADIKADPITTLTGDVREIVERVACLVYGETLVIENARVYGALPIVLAAIRQLIRGTVNPKFPRLLAEDIPGREFKTLAKAHLGVKKVVARVNEGFVPEPKSFGATLDSMFKKKGLKKFKQITASIEAPKNDSLDPDTVLELVDQSEGNIGLSGIAVTFNDGTSLAELDKYREKTSIEVQEVRPGVPAVTEIETKMLEYLNELATSKDANARVIDSKGYFLKKP
ncbi:hypothetical protein [Xanthomonas sacchari]|uniref:hypothetical protein n=1 Tax=Xanthomonas sacchari TaxID=56458 RepID=UPI00225273D3|nr:hypothetical protein [Xanthomonas sacchari]MCW0447211.1 hypothetical protein [Xanthomonas sacchari]